MTASAASTVLTTLRTAGAVARLLGEDVARSYRVLVPSVLFAGVLAVLFGGDPGPLPVPWAASALLLYPIGAWVTHCLAEAEDDVQRTVTVSAAGGPAPVTIGVLMAGSAGVALLSLLAVVWGTVASFSSATVGNLFDGLCAHVACGLTGVAVGLVCARPVIGHLGWALLGGLTFLLVTGTQPWLPPVGTAVAALGTGRTGIGPFGDVLLAATLAVAVALLVVRAESGWLAGAAGRLEPLLRRLPPRLRDRLGY